MTPRPVAVVVRSWSPPPTSPRRSWPSMYQQVLRANGSRLRSRNSPPARGDHPALQTGEVQLTPEYLGSPRSSWNKEANGADAPQVATGDAQATHTEAQTLAEPADLTLLEPSAAQDQNAFAVTQAFADQNGLSTLSELGTYSPAVPDHLGRPECPKRPFCQPGLEETYNVDVGSFVPLDAGDPLTIQALKQDKVNVGLVFSSSGWSRRMTWWCWRTTRVCRPRRTSCPRCTRRP